MTAPGSGARGIVLPRGLRDDPASSPGCYRVIMRDPRGWTVRPIVDAGTLDEAFDKGLVLFPRSAPIHAALIHERGPHPSTERFMELVGRVDRRRRVA